MKSLENANTLHSRVRQKGWRLGPRRHGRRELYDAFGQLIGCYTDDEAFGVIRADDSKRPHLIDGALAAEEMFGVDELESYANQRRRA